MKKFEKIKTYKEIKNITNIGKKHVLKSCIIYEIIEEKEVSQIGILLSKKFGNAVKRNFARRRIVATLNEIEVKINSQKTLVFIPRNQIIKMEYAKILAEISCLF